MTYTYSSNVYHVTAEMISYGGSGSLDSFQTFAVDKSHLYTFAHGPAPQAVWQCLSLTAELRVTLLGWCICEKDY